MSDQGHGPCWKVGIRLPTVFTFGEVFWGPGLSPGTRTPKRSQESGFSSLSSSSHKIYCGVTTSRITHPHPSHSRTCKRGVDISQVLMKTQVPLDTPSPSDTLSSLELPWGFRVGVGYKDGSMLHGPSTYRWETRR